jgi:oxygen-independent coproporphyrinogen-3 oxidase
MARARWSQAPDDDAATMYVTAMERLDAAGYEQYEISNVGRPGRRSRHNLKYWTDGEWLGFGCGAHSTLDGVRWKNVSATEEYVDRVSRSLPTGVDIHRLTEAGAAMRCSWVFGSTTALTNATSSAAMDRVEALRLRSPAVREAGLLIRRDRGIRLTRRGMLLANEVMAVFVELKKLKVTP